MNVHEDTAPLFAHFDPITLAEMDAVALQSRTDTKYMFSTALLPAILEDLRGEYRLLHVDGVPGARYRTRYLDTPDRRHYLDHHNGRTFRSKVRFREYIGSGLCFLEVKRKTGRGGTDKVRMRVPCIPDAPTAEQLEFVRKATGRMEPLGPVLWNTFTRYTFVHRTRNERLTMDLGLTFTAGTETFALTGTCVAELKEERADRRSPFTALMRALGERPRGMSKYCIGLIGLGLAPRANNFKPVLLRLRKLRQAA